MEAVNKPIKVSLVHQLDNGAKLGLSQAPGKVMREGRDGKPHHRNLGNDITDYKNRQTSVIVCLLNDSELKLIGVNPTSYKRICSANEIELIQYPIIEMAAPAEDAAYFDFALIEPLVCRLSEGKNIVVHCRGGIGRAGLVACCLLGRLGQFENYRDAIRHVRARRDRRCVESRNQEVYIKKYYEFLKSLH